MTSTETCLHIRKNGGIRSKALQSLQALNKMRQSISSGSLLIFGDKFKVTDYQKQREAVTKSSGVGKVLSLVSTQAAKFRNLVSTVLKET